MLLTYMMTLYHNPLSNGLTRNGVSIFVSAPKCRDGAGSVGTYNHTAIRAYACHTLIIFITNYTVLRMFKHNISHVQNSIANWEFPVSVHV